MTDINTSSGESDEREERLRPDPTPPAQAPAATSVGEPVYAECYVCGRPMDGLSEADCHCFHRKELLATPPAAPAATEAPSISREEWIAEAKQAYLEAGDEEPFAAEQAAWLWTQQDHLSGELEEPRAAVQEDLHGRPRPVATPAPAVGASPEPEKREEAPPNNLPDYDECARLIENSAFRARAAAGLEGAVLTTLGQSPEPTELHRFIHEYDDADRYRSAWFLHRLEKVINEARAVGASVQPVPASLSDEHLCELEHVEETLRQIAGGEIVSGGTVDRIGDIRRARGIASIAHRRLSAVTAALASSTPTKGGQTS